MCASIGALSSAEEYIFMGVRSVQKCCKVTLLLKTGEDYQSNKCRLALMLSGSSLHTMMCNVCRLGCVSVHSVLVDSKYLWQKW